MQRSTLIIGYGAYGRDALERLLRQSAYRGVLRWKRTQSGGVASAQRRLDGLALLAVPNPYEEAAAGVAAVAGAPQFLTDLYRQIHELPDADREAPEAAADLVRRLANDLLTQSGFAVQQPVGLDLIVLARPGTPEAIPHLDLLLQEALGSLATLSFFETAVQGAENLNSILVLDFDNLWLSAGAPQQGLDNARDLRAALRNSVQSWELRRDRRQPAVARCYLVDGSTLLGQRPRPQRLDETVLFLELLLFEGLRGEQPLLYQQTNPGQPITATFGVRLLEESVLVLSRKAAATFGRQWLDRLIGDERPCPDRPARRVIEVLAPCQGLALEQLIDDGRLRALFDARIAGLTDDLMAVPGRNGPNWAEEVVEAFEEARQRLEKELEQTGWEILGSIREDRLKGFDENLVKAVGEDLHDPRGPVSLALVQAQMQGLIEELAPRPMAGASHAPDAGAALAGLRRMHRAYRAQLDEWLSRQGRDLRWFWPLFALVLAIGLAPLSVQLLTYLKAPATGSTLAWLAPVVAGLHRFNQPLYWVLLWAALGWWVFARLIQPRITALIDRALRFFIERERGRFRQQILALVEPLSESMLTRVQRNIRSSLANQLLKSLSRVAERLAERAREMDWLRKQLNSFLTQSTPEDTPVRKWVQREGAFEATLAANPPNPERLCSPQPQLAEPFAGWQEYFCEAFLDPLRFIDDLSEPYRLAQEDEESRQSVAADLADRRRELVEYLDASNLAPACRFIMNEGVTNEQRWCIAAQRWRNVAGLEHELNSRLGIRGEDILHTQDQGRVYLLTLQTGIAATRLERAA